MVLRYEPQFHSIYAAFDSRRILTHFYSSEQYSILEYLARKPCERRDLHERFLRRNDDLDAFIDKELRTNFIVDIDSSRADLVHVPPRTEPGAFEGFPAPFLSAPTTVDLFLTRACNLKCCHCFAEGGSPLKGELSHDEWLSIFDQLEQMGVLQVRLTGGEPFMRRRILELLEFLGTKRFQKLLVTNGTMLNDKIVGILTKSDIVPTVSLDGATAEVHDAFRGVPGAFQRTLRGITSLHRSGIMYGLNTCVHTENIGQIEDIVRFGIKMGASRIGLLGLQPVGRAKKMLDDSVSNVEYLILGLRLMQMARRYKGKIEISPELLSGEIPLRSTGAFTCTIDSNGGVYPDNLVLGNEKYRVDNVRLSSFREAWFSHRWIPFRKGLPRKGKLSLIGLPPKMPTKQKE